MLVRSPGNDGGGSQRTQTGNDTDSKGKKENNRGAHRRRNCPLPVELSRKNWQAPQVCDARSHYLLTLFKFSHDYLLDKSKASWSNSFMDSNPHFFLGLAAAASFRMSLLIDASNFLVGTRSSNFFLPLSNGGLL
jgi:hypothetical protein